MDLYVVYHDPSDFPDQYVIRRQITGCGTVTAAPEPLAVGPDLDQVRAKLPPGLTRLERDLNDAPSILEIWV